MTRFHLTGVWHWAREDAVSWDAVPGPRCSQWVRVQGRFCISPCLEKPPLIHCRTGRFVGNAVMWLCTPSAGRPPRCVPRAQLLLGFEDPQGSLGYLSTL